MIVGQISLKTELTTSQLKNQIVKEARSSWLDYETSSEFLQEMNRARDPLHLKSLLQKVKFEINQRKIIYGRGLK